MAVSDFLKSIFTWWHGGTFGAKFHIGRRGLFIGQDELGNRYFEAKDTSDSYDGRKRRWVIFNGYAEASKVSPDWHGWLHHTFAQPPTVEPFVVKSWEKAHRPNLTGTIHAYRPDGALGSGGERQRAASDYEAWTPE
jgi:NADH:ubiquinone oxidoreductase subunit